MSATTRGFIYGCGQCRFDLTLKADLTIVATPSDAWEQPPASEPCGECAEVMLTGIEPHNECDIIRNAVTQLMGWCGCGSPEDVTELVVEYLTSLESDEWEVRNEKWGRYGDLLGYIVDDLGWTEHGGSVGGAWLTETGRTALAALRERFRR